MYLADSLFSRQILKREKLFYMLDWTQALETMEHLEAMPSGSYIMAHQGTAHEIGELARDNRRHLTGILKEMLELCDGEITLEQLTVRAARFKEIQVRSVEKARFLERVIRSMAEYWLEQGRLEIRLREGIPVYSRRG